MAYRETHEAIIEIGVQAKLLKKQEDGCR
jgi:hypothetical protein